MKRMVSMVSLVSLRFLIPSVLTVALLAGPVVSAGAAENACRLATRAEASAVLGKPSMVGHPEGENRCFFAAADTKGAPASEYADLGLDQHDSVEDAEILFAATERLPGTVPVTGLGNRAQFREEPGGGRLLVRVGTRTVLVSVASQSQKEPLAALRVFAAAVLSRL